MAAERAGLPGRESFVAEQLCVEFGERLDPVTIRMVAAEELARFADARVREFVPIFAWRRARARLKDLVEQGTPATRDELGQPA